MATEKRLIDANELGRFSFHIMCYCEDGEALERCVVDWDDIETAPTVDAAEVVRCKDCKHWQPIHEHIPHMECQIFCGAYEHGYPTNADDYCSYGERKDNDGL